MKTTDLNKVMKGITLPDKYIKKGRLAYYILKHDTDASILVGFLLGNCSDKDSFILHYFAQCLYEPFVTYNLSLGDRIGLHWKVRDLPEINQKLSKFNEFDTLNSFKDFIPFLEKNNYYGEVTGRNMYFALTYFIEKNFKESLKYLDEILKLKNHTNLEWLKQDILYAEQIKSYIIENDYQIGIEQLLKWQQETISAIKFKI